MKICYKLSSEPLNIALLVNYQTSKMLAVMNLRILKVTLTELEKYAYTLKFPSGLNCFVQDSLH